MVKLKKLRPRCFFDISIGQETIGRVIFELFNDVCPKTCENFKALCTGERGLGKLTAKPLHYKNVKFHRIVKNFIIQSGDFSQGNGKGGESIFGGTFEDESFHFKHEKPFLLSMANRGKNTNGSQFFITLAPAPHLDGVHVVFGHVISGQEVVLKIANQAVDSSSRPLVDVLISNCGELIPQIKPKDEKKKKSKKRSSKRSDSDESDDDSKSEESSDNSESSSSDSDNSSSDEESSRHKRNRKNKTKEDANQANKERSDEIKEGSDNEVDFAAHFNAPKHSVSIKPEEIPEIPPNKFLARGFKTKENENNVEKDRSDNSDKKYEKPYIRKFSYSRSGRKIKGRGFIRFRTPSPDNERFRRSETPPHWKMAQAKVKPFKEIISQSQSSDQEEKDKQNGNGVNPSNGLSGDLHRENKYSYRSRNYRRSRSRSRSRERFSKNSDRSRQNDRSHRNRRSSSPRSRNRHRSGNDNTNERRSRSSSYDKNENKYKKNISNSNVKDKLNENEKKNEDLKEKEMVKSEIKLQSDFSGDHLSKDSSHKRKHDERNSSSRSSHQRSKDKHHKSYKEEKRSKFEHSPKRRSRSVSYSPVR